MASVRDTIHELAVDGSRPQHERVAECRQLLQSLTGDLVHNADDIKQFSAKSKKESLAPRGLLAGDPHVCFPCLFGLFIHI